jgi:hypothetical protein
MDASTLAAFVFKPEDDDLSDRRGKTPMIRADELRTFRSGGTLRQLANVPQVPRASQISKTWSISGRSSPADP